MSFVSKGSSNGFRSFPPQENDTQLSEAVTNISLSRPSPSPALLIHQRPWNQPRYPVLPGAVDVQQATQVPCPEDLSN